MKNKKIIIFVIILFIILVPIFVLALRSLQNKGNKQIPNFPFPSTSVQNPSLQQLSVLKTLPPDKSTNVPIVQSIIIVFNRQFSLSEFVFVIQPEITYSLSIQGSQLTVSFMSPLATQTQYAYGIIYKNNASPQSFTFTTVQSVATNGSNDTVAGKNDELTKQQFPDIFVYNRTPFVTDDFALYGDFTQTPTQHHFFYFASKTDPTKAHQALLNWFTSLGLTDDQIKQLDIRPQPKRGL